MSDTDFRKANVCIVGGKGRMGRWFVSLFREAGMDTIVSDLDDSPISEKSVASCDIVLLAVPVTAIEGVMRSIGPFIRSDALLMDISSIKRDPINFMLKYSQSEVIGTHPLFGPSTASLVDQVVFLCPSRTERWIKPFRNFLEERGAKITEITPDGHDKLMACFQTLRHVMLTSLGQTLIRLGFDSHCQVEGTGAWFEQLLAMMCHQFEQPSELYADLAIGNSYSSETLKLFRNSLNELANLVSTGNRDGLVSAMDEVAQFCATEATSNGSAWGWWRDIGGDSRHIEV
ncbi:MAG: prephenate dehydrogenase/arogenate dehydrogenase family protein [Syntrophaceae bacterium]|nr:prephenate dehydrogenase/arogenate dehydrogenase family protein [Syntrophaceae bacterium]